MDLNSQSPAREDDSELINEEMDATDGGEAKFAAVDTKSGEEQLSLVGGWKGKILRFDEGENAWKERGQGECKIFQYKNDNNQHRLVFRRDGTGKLGADHNLQYGMKIMPMAGSEKQLIWKSPCDYSEGDAEGYPELFLMKFPNPEVAQEFKAAFDIVTVGKAPK
jgi:hypothetical protein